MVPFNMEEAGSGYVSNRWSDLLSGMNDIHPECIHCIATEMYNV